MSVRDQRGPPQSEGPNLGKIEDMRNHSAVFRGECTRLILETDKACRRMQDDDSKRLGQRVRDIQFVSPHWKCTFSPFFLETSPSLSLAVTPTQWETISDINIAKAEQQKTNSLSLRAFVESLLEQMTADVQKQAQATIAAFQLNVQEIKSAKSQMEDQLGKILSEIASQQRISEDLKVAITEKGRFLSLAQARLDLRERRPVKEQCHDPAQTQLLTEVQQLTAHINKLREAVAQSEEEQRAMVRCQIDLEEIIQVKVTCLYIDEVTCPQHKEPIFIHNF